MTSQYKESGKGIKPLIQKAEKGNLEAQFQLYEYYENGKHVDKDEDLAQKYLKLLENTLIDKSLRINTLRLSEFRRFHNLDISLDKNITVIIGDNGAGKTSIAEAIAKTFSWLNNNLEKDDVNGRFLIESDINVDASDYAETTSNFQFDKNNKFQASLAKATPGFTRKQSNEVRVIKQFGAMYRRASKNPSIMIPLLAFYSVERSYTSIVSAFSEKASGDITGNRFSALKDALDGAKLDSFPELYIELVNLAEGEDTKEVKYLRDLISSLEKNIYEVYEGKPPSADDLFFARLKAKKEELAALLLSKSSAKYQRHLRFVNQAIETLVPDVKNLEVDRSLGKARLLVENLGNKVNISQLSQGQKMMVSLTGDLARRLVTLNPDSERPLHCHGIVIIDEIELHLHPRWQQEILIGLQNTFPNIQFIVTTHSPQILSTVDNKCIRKICLDEEGHPTVLTPNFQTKGVASADILTRIMGTNSIPDKIEEAVWVSNFFECLNIQDKESAAKYLIKITSHFGEQHPVVVDCKSQLRIIDMKKRLTKN